MNATLIFTGDLYLKAFRPPGNRDVKRSMADASYVISNFEGVIRDDRTYRMRFDKQAILTVNDEDVASYVEWIGATTVFCLGNNHVHDLGEAGLCATRKSLANISRVVSCGAGLPGEVLVPTVLRIADRSMALLCVSTDDPEVMAHVANGNEQGVLDYDDPRIPDVIRQIKNEVDYCAILAHWGREYIPYPSCALRKKAHRWIEAGADLIVGHHPHVIQGKERYRGKWIYYSLGNFIFPNFFNKNGLQHAWKKESKQSIMLRVAVGSELTLQEVGLRFDSETGDLMPDKDAYQMLIHRSHHLDLQACPMKMYHGVWEAGYGRFLHEKDAYFRRFIRRWFPRHCEHARFKYFLMRVRDKIRGGIQWI